MEEGSSSEANSHAVSHENSLHFMQPEVLSPRSQNLLSKALFNIAYRTLVEVFWVVTPCSVVIGYQSLRGPC